MSIKIVLLSFFLIVSCTSNVIFNKNNKDLTFSSIESDYHVSDVESYGCEAIDAFTLEYVLQNSISVTSREVHDHYSTVGCSVEGTLKVESQAQSFVFDYGGVIRFSGGLILACGELCCRNDFKYCTWDDGL